MGNQRSQTSNQIVKNRPVTLLELLDRLVDKGVVVKGEILLSVADMDLIYLNLGLLLSSVKTVENAARRGEYREAKVFSRKMSSHRELLEELQGEKEIKMVSAPSLPIKNSKISNRNKESINTILPSDSDSKRNRHIKPKTNIDPGDVEKGLVKLVLTIVELIRQLMEKQAIRRIEDEQLEVSDIENVGNAFFLLNEKMAELKKMFDLTDEDLNLDLGPLGNLL
jgi:Gas vesicle protein K/Gas vesicle protein